MFLPDQACAGSLAKPHVVQLCRCPHISPARAGLSSPAAHPLSQRNAGPVNPELGISRVARKLCTTLAALAVDESPLSPTHSIDLEHIAEGDYCLPGEVNVDNHSHVGSTIVSVEVKDYPGLLRVVAWVLNGLDYVVQNARLTTDSEGYAHNRFWVVHRNGRKLSNTQAELLAERVGDFVVYCTPNRKMIEADTFGDDRISVCNSDHERFSVVRIVSDHGPGALLQVASAMTGVGISIHEAVIQGCTNCGGPEIDAGFDHNKGRLFKFWVTDRHGEKLDYARATALVYTMGLAFGAHGAHGSTTAPNSSIGPPVPLAV